LKDGVETDRRADRRTDGRTDGGDYITSRANAVGNYPNIAIKTVNNALHVLFCNEIAFLSKTSESHV